MNEITILIIEDEPTINRIVSNYFSREKYKWYHLYLKLF